MNEEQWDYKIDGKTGGVAKLVVWLVLSILFVVLTIDQLQAQPHKSLAAAFAFGSTAAVLLCLFVVILVRHICFKVYIGSKGFYFQSNPWNGTYYTYTDMIRGEEELRVYHRRKSSDQYCYYFILEEKNGKTTKFQFEKSVHEREINVLKERIERK